MNASHEKVRSATERFFIGFFSSGCFAFFVALFSYRGSASQAILGAAGVGLLVGFLFGVLSAFSKKLLQFMVAFMKQVGPF